MKKLWLMLAMMVCVLAGCSDGGSDNPVNPTPKPEEVKTEITIDSGIISNGLSFTSSQGEQSISFSVNADWTLSVASTTSGATWCKASATSGSKGSANVKFTIDENTSYDDRSVSVTIKAGTVSKTFTITQKGADAMLVTTTKYEVAQEGGKIEVEVKANIDYQFAISDTAKDWITEAKSKSRGLTTYKHTFEIANNEDVEKREGEITFKSGDKVETVKVYQAGGAIILLTQNEYTVSDAGETISVDIKSNVDFGVQMPDVDWITDEASSRGMSSHTLKYVIAANEGYDSRSAEIIFYDKNSDLKDTLKVVQAQKNAIILSQKEMVLKSKGETIEVKLASNVDFEMVLPNVQWISESTSARSLVEYKKYLTISENKSESSREAKVVFKNQDNESIADTLHIVQNGYGVMKVSQSEYKVDANGKTISVRLQTNGEYDVIMPEIDWITHNVESRATSTYYESFTVLPNDIYDERKAEIIFKGKTSDAADTITVIQQPKNGIVVAKKEYLAKAEKDTISVIVSSNVTFRAEISYKYDDWIEQYIPEKSRALNDSTLYFIIAENKDYNKREGYVLFKDKNSYNTPVDTIKVIQEGRSTTPSLVLNVTPAGSLNTLISENRKTKVEEMKLTGELNGTDFAFIKGMSNLKNLDLSEVTIVEGGDAYHHSREINGRPIGYYYDIYIPAFDLYTKKNSIGGSMFPNSLKVLTVPANVETIMGYSVTVYKREGNRIDGYRHTPVSSSVEYVFDADSKITKIIFPENARLKEIGHSFSKCYSLYEIILPNSLEKIGSYAFNECTNLKTIKLPNSVKEITSQAFYGSRGLNSINLPDKLTYIPDSLFFGCSNLSAITIPKSVTKIDSLAFANCGLTSINIPNNVKHISAGAFMGCSNLTNVTLPNSIKTIEYFTFGGTGVSTITIPNSVTEIQAAAFFKCQNLESIVIPESVKTISYSTFENCSKLSDVTLPSGIAEISEGFFKNCTSLDEITIPEGVTEIKEAAFSGCSSLASIDIPKNVTSIGDEAFEGCSIKTLVIPNLVATIGRSAFYNNKPMTKITLGSGLKSVGGAAFAKNWSSNEKKIYYSEVVCNTTTPAVVSSGSFSGGINDESKLYIPKGTYNAYYLSDWANIFDNIVEMK